LTRYPRWSAARRMRSRAWVETLAPGVKARDTAERETPARFATSAAVTNARRADSWPTLSSGSCNTRASSYPVDAHVCNHGPIFAETIFVGTTLRNDNCLKLRGMLPERCSRLRCCMPTTVGEGQGYYFGRPVVAEEFAELLGAPMRRGSHRG